MGIRGKLLLLAIGIALPLVIVGALDLSNMWQLSRSQLDDSVKQQVDLASVALERWLDDQRKSLAAISASAADHDTSFTDIRANLEDVLHTRPHWLDLRVTNATGTTVVSQPERKEPLANALTEHLAAEMKKRNSWTVLTDRTQDEARPIVIIAVPIETGGAVIARIDGAAINELFDSIELSPQVVISVLDAEGRVLYRRRGSEAATEADINWAPLSSTLPAQQTSVMELTSPIDGIKRVYGVARVRDTALIAMLGIPSAKLYEPARRHLIRYSVIALVALLLAVGAALIIERSIVLPVRRLRSAAQLLGSGDLEARASINETGEIGDLATAFNAMATRIKEREDRLTELDLLKSDFVSSVSHELKTPLTTIKLLAHLLQKSGLDERDKLDYLRTIAAECDRQIDLVGNLLDLSRIEAGVYQLRKKQVVVDQLIMSCVEVEKNRAESLGLSISTDFPFALPSAQGDEEALRRVLRGLIDNALKYTPEGGHVAISASLDDQMLAIRIKDNGQGIAPDDIPHVFDKFYRGSSLTADDENQSSSTGTSASGVGLGLYLARRIVAQLDGTISVESGDGHGASFTIHLPLWLESVNSEMSEKENSDVEKTFGS